MRLLGLSAVCLCLAAPCRAGAVSFEEIAGARIAEGGFWHLALGGPTDGVVITKPLSLRTTVDQSTHLIDVPALLSGKEFTVLLCLREVQGGVIALESPQVPGDRRSVMVSEDRWVPICFGPAQWKDSLSLHVRCTAPLSIRQVTVYRSFAQSFGSGGRVTLVGAAYHKLGEDELLGYPLLPAAYQEPNGRWQQPPTDRRDGITGARLGDSYQSFLNSPLQEELGVAIPVRAPNGVVLCARMHGHFAFVTYPEKAKYTLTWKGEANEWTTPALRCDGALLDGNGNGVFTGVRKVHWATANTLTDNYGKGFLDFVALLPQNEIPVKRDAWRRLVFEYQSATGLKRAEIPLTAKTDGVALVNAGEHRTSILLRSAQAYRETMVIEDSAYADRLAVRAGSVRASPSP